MAGGVTTAPPRRVLIVGERAALRFRVRGLLAPGVFAAEEASTGIEALRLLRGRRFDFAVLLVGLAPPAGDRQFLEGVQAEKRTHDLHVVAVGSGTQGEALAAALALGAAETCPEVRSRALLPAVLRALALNGEGLPPRPADVLHVEMDDEWADLARRWLGRMGLRVHHVSTRGELEAYLLNCRLLPRCLLLDLSLPQAGGLGLCDRLKASPAWQGLPIVALTGRAGSALECLKHHLLYRVVKRAGAEAELCALLREVLAEQERAQGVFEVGDLRLDPREGEVLQRGRLLAKLEPGPFAAFVLLVSSPSRLVYDESLYKAFLCRKPYRKRDPELGFKATLRDYVSRLRKSLGGEVAARIVRYEGAGYAYLSPGGARP